MKRGRARVGASSLSESRLVSLCQPTHRNASATPETIYIVKDGMDAGWPRCHSGRIIDPDFGGSGACDGVARPVVEMQAHSAPLGLAVAPDGSLIVSDDKSGYIYRITYGK